MQGVVCNAGPLIALAKLKQLEILAELYQKVHIPEPVHREVVTQGLARGAPDALTLHLFLQRRDWPIVTVSNSLISSYTPAVILDPGEMAVLALAQTFEDPLVLLDDEVARSEARRLELRVRGTLGILVHAFRRQLLSYNQIELLLEEVAARPDIWISAGLCEQVMISLQSSDRQSY
jgi:predicted nucleic acid-binding protein